MNFTVYQDPATVLNVSETSDILIEHAEETAIEAELGPSAFFFFVSSNILTTWLLQGPVYLLVYTQYVLV